MEQRDTAMGRASAVPEVVDEPERNRLEVNVDGVVAELRYAVRDGRLVLIHTGVPDELAGHGVGGLLVQAAVDKAAREGLDIVAVCPFASEWIEHHPEALGQVRLVG